MSTGDIERQITEIAREMREFEALAGQAHRGQSHAQEFLSSRDLDGFSERGILHIAKLAKLFDDIAALATTNPQEARRLTLKAYRVIGAAYSRDDEDPQ